MHRCLNQGPEPSIPDPLPILPILCLFKLTLRYREAWNVSRYAEFRVDWLYYLDRFFIVMLERVEDQISKIYRLFIFDSYW